MKFLDCTELEAFCTGVGDSNILDKVLEFWLRLESNRCVLKLVVTLESGAKGPLSLKFCVGLWCKSPCRFMDFCKYWLMTGRGGRIFLYGNIQPNSIKV